MNLQKRKYSTSAILLVIVIFIRLIIDVYSIVYISLTYFNPLRIIPTIYLLIASLSIVPNMIILAGIFAKKLWVPKFVGFLMFIDITIRALFKLIFGFGFGEIFIFLDLLMGGLAGNIGARILGISPAKKRKLLSPPTVKERLLIREMTIKLLPGIFLGGIIFGITKNYLLGALVMFMGFITGSLIYPSLNKK